MNSLSASQPFNHIHNILQNSRSQKSEISSTNLQTNSHIKTTYTQLFTNVQNLPQILSNTPTYNTIPPSTVPLSTVSNST